MTADIRIAIHSKVSLLIYIEIKSMFIFIRKELIISPTFIVSRNVHFIQYQRLFADPLLIMQKTFTTQVEKEKKKTQTKSCVLQTDWNMWWSVNKNLLHDGKWENSNHGSPMKIFFKPVIEDLRMELAKKCTKLISDVSDLSHFCLTLHDKCGTVMS